MLHPCQFQRKASVLPLVAVCLTALFAFLALAIDLGVLALAKTQCQVAADSAALAGVRALNGNSALNNNSTTATSNAISAATANQVLSNAVSASRVTVDLGSYSYNTTQQKFAPNIPRLSGENYSLVKASVNADSSVSFGQLLGVKNIKVTATATAVHRPRDIAIILDFSGSMRFSSLPGLPYTGNRTTSNNPDSTYPTFGHYSSSSVTLRKTTITYDSSGNAFNPSNVSEANSYNGNIVPIVNDFYRTTGSSPVAAFSGASLAFATTPGGDVPPKSQKDSGSGWAVTATEFLGSTSKDTTFETNGFDGHKVAGRAFSGYTQGPGYWGKTFFQWPPDPRAANDWRQKFFIDATTNNPVKRNIRLFSSTGVWQIPSSTTYKINYQAILKWLVASPNPFPTQLRAGRILYYSAIPDGNDNSLNNRFWTQYPLTNTNERFWKDYIDYVLGLRQTGSSSWMNITAKTGYGDMFSWGTSTINTGFDPATDSQGRYMDYDDNPRRPKLQFWFGPITFVDFLGNYNLWYDFLPNASQYCWIPGTAHEPPLYACKLGMQAALNDIQNNHPNDLVTIIMFATPQTSSTSTNGGRFNRARTPLSNNYPLHIESLWFPPSTYGNSSAEINPYDYAKTLEIPHAMGGTCYSMGLMIAYNQFSGNSSLVTYNPSPALPGDAGGNGRKGAQKLVIFQTDGMPSVPAQAQLVNSGAYNSYYKIRYNSTTPSAGEFPTSNSATITTEIYALCNQLCALDTANPPGYSTGRKPVLLHAVAFGPIFSAGSPSRNTGLGILQQMQTIGKTQSDSTVPLADYKIVIGSDTDMKTKMHLAITSIMEYGVPVSLID